MQGFHPLVPFCCVSLWGGYHKLAVDHKPEPQEIKKKKPTKKRRQTVNSAN